MLSDQVTQFEFLSNTPWSRNTKTTKNSSFDSSGNVTLSQQIVPDTQDVFTQNSQSPSKKFYRRFMQKKSLQGNSVVKISQDSGKILGMSHEKENYNLDTALDSIFNILNSMQNEMREKYTELNQGIQQLKENVNELSNCKCGKTQNSENDNVVEFLERILYRVSKKDKRLYEIQNKLVDEKNKNDAILKEIYQLQLTLNALRKDCQDKMFEIVQNLKESYEEIKNNSVKQQKQLDEKIEECLESVKSLKKINVQEKSPKERTILDFTTESNLVNVNYFRTQESSRGWENKWSSPACNIKSFNFRSQHDFGVVLGARAIRAPKMLTIDEQKLTQENDLPTRKRKTQR